MTTIPKKPKARFGRIPRIVKLPAGLHKNIKDFAKVRGTTASDLYDQIVCDFVKKVKNSTEKPEYLFHQGAVEKISIYLKEKNVENVKEIVVRDSVSENRVFFTAIIGFSKKMI